MIREVARKSSLQPRTLGEIVTQFSIASPLDISALEFFTSSKHMKDTYTDSDILIGSTGPSQQIGGSITWNCGYWCLGLDQGQPDMAPPPSSTEDPSPTFTTASNPPSPTNSSIPPGPSVTPPQPTPSTSSTPSPFPPASPTPPVSETPSGLPVSIIDPRPTSINIIQLVYCAERNIHDCTMATMATMA